MNELQPYTPQPLMPAIPPGMTVGYTAQGQPVYVPQAPAPAPVVVQMPSQPLPAWLRNLLVFAVTLLVLCTPATVLLIVAVPAITALGESLAWSGVGIGIAVIGVAAAIKALRETPKPSSDKKS